MIKSIHLHLSEDAERQAALEAECAQKLAQQKQLNQVAFQTMMPNLAVVFDEEIVDDYGLFCNKMGKLNLASQSSGQVVYGLDPQQESEAEILDFLIQAPQINLTGPAVKASPLLRAFQIPESQGYVPALPLAPVPSESDTIIMFGLGLGYALEAILKYCSPKNIIIYEPELDFFRASVQVANWHFIFQTAQEKNVRLFLQIGQDGQSVGTDLTELQSAFGAETIFLYRHYHHPVMDAVFERLIQPSFQLSAFYDAPLTAYEQANHYVLARAGQLKSTISQAEAAIKIAESTQLKVKNLAAFEQAFPSIYQQFKAYKPAYWQGFIDISGELNLYHMDRLAPWYVGQPSQLAEQAIEVFKAEPNKNDMFTGYSGGKLRHYIHFSQARAFGKLSESLEAQGTFVPKVMSSIFWFGLGLGYELEKILTDFDVKSLYIYEPNLDFFYWSLFSIPWHSILKEQREKGLHWYINLGDDGRYLQEDTFSQFQTSGGYLAASAYFYIPQFIPAMQRPIQQLKRDLQSFLMLGEYFDHVRYSFRHTEANLQRGSFVLKADHQNASFTEVPVVIVGNGPSLDKDLQRLAKRQREFIIISCGTALKALYQAGIRPDFHSEVEQNRATYQWITQVPDRQWLKEITLLSLTATHPDTVALFKEHLALFKYGESSTLAYIRRAGLQKQIKVVDYCYPTVSNLALTTTLALGFKNIYLLGVDLGYKDIEHHHAKGSAYYNNKEKSWHNYAKAVGQSIPVQGNFEPHVLTKYEFQLSKRIMEQCLRGKEHQTQVWNASDGAYIEGTEPILLANVPNYPDFNPVDTLAEIKETCFTQAYKDLLLAVVKEGFDNKKILTEAEELLALTQVPVTRIDEAIQQLEKEKNYLLGLFHDSPTLWFYLIYASAHFASSALIRFLYQAENESQGVDYFEQGREIWRDYLRKIIASWEIEPEQWDQTEIKYLPPVEPLVKP